MKNIFPCFLLPLLLLAFQSLPAQSSRTDSLEMVLSRQADDTAKVNLLNQLSNAWLSEGDSYGSISSASEALTLAENLEYKPGQAMAHYCLGKSASVNENYAEALLHLMNAADLYNQIGNKKQLARSYMLVANVHAMMANDVQALASYKKAEQAALAVPNSGLLEPLYLNMSTIYINQGNHEEGMRCCLKAKNEAVKNGDKSGEAYVYESIGRIWEGEGNNKEAMDSYGQAFDIYTQVNDKRGKTRMGYIIGGNYNLQQNPAEALKWHQQAMQDAREIGDAEIVRDLLWAMSDDYADQKNYQAAHAAMAEFVEVNDSIRSAEFSRKLAVLQMHFETQKKEAQIEKLQGKSENPVQIGGGISLTLILIVVIIVLFVAGVIFSIIAQQRFSALRRQMEAMQQAKFNKNTGTNFPRN